VRLGGPARFAAGTLVGVTLVTAAGAGLALQHPHFISRVQAHLLDLFPQGGEVPVSLGSVSIQCDIGAPGTAISPLIYGVAGADSTTLVALGATLNRWGGNPAERYNWVLGHAWNATRDWEFRNVNYTDGTGSTADNFVTSTLSAGDVPLMTVPALGWVAKDTNNDHRSTGVPGQGGPPTGPGSAAIAGYDPTANRVATSIPSLPSKVGALSDPPNPSAAAVYQDEWVQHLVDLFGAAPKGVTYFTIGNEPDLWSLTDTDVHPVQMGYDAMVAMYENYARAVKAQDPGAQILGPDLSGWTALWYSALDRGSDNYATHADRLAHGDQPFLPWWLAQIAKSDKAAGVRTLDYLDVHYYPQADGVDSKANDLSTQLLRIRSTRSLYDPTYKDESWIGEPVALIPRLKAWIAANYPGTKLAISEYRWGGENDASGGVALADVLGIFGREGVDMASYWQSPPVDSPAGAAFRLYRNYDGHGAAFGDRSLPCRSSASPVAVFGSRHSDTGEVDVVLTNEDPSKPATVNLDFGLNATASIDRFQVAAGSSQITQLSSLSSSAAVTLPPFSLTLLRLKAA
jgi:Glycoside hydrolase family 44